MLAKFSREHWHDEDEVRFIVEGRGLFHVHPAEARCSRSRSKRGTSSGCLAGHITGSISAPIAGSGRSVCSRITSGWTPHYTDTGIDQAVSTSLLWSLLRVVDGRVTAGATTAGIRAILLDIEGTTTPIAFVHEVLFPYARRNLRRHLEQHAASPEYDSLLDRLRDEHAGDRVTGQGVPPWVEAPHAARLAAVVSLQ